MIKLPLDMIKIIANFLTLPELYAMKQSDRDFFLPKHEKIKRINWCGKRIQIHAYRDGKCSDNTCDRQKTMCIQIEPLKRVVLSNYCSIHTKIHTNQNFFNI